tara:strand:+ start:170 stop:280 length:111 start_codon:yes stop_codon:yes gene_type:complete
MIEKAINYSFDALYKYIKEKKAEERRKEKLKLIFMI